MKMHGSLTWGDPYIAYIILIDQYGLIEEKIIKWELKQHAYSP